ncbi:uncharacterized protein LOC125877540 [Solanum stenotomum]|uniref:uncharacterized protein LOC125877540 n=1 Tax=Solanum stenotomum TaxID=172797 RepID=UPI0020D0EF41|nr:uncharacterized protein LOC125877540 [Solanum stenotomum]
MDDANTNRIYNYEDTGWEENRSKNLHDPLLMANVKDGKKKNDFASSSKIDNPNELHVRHVNGNILRFGIKEFAMITGLKCIGDPNDFQYPNTSKSSLIQKYFPNLVKSNSVSKARLVNRFLQGNWDNDQDVFHMGILYFLNTFVLSQLPESPIHVNDFLLVEDGTYEHFPWGQRAFSRLMMSWRKERTKVKQLYRLSGMPYALNVWVYECASNACTNIQPTREELIILQLPDNLVVSHTKNSLSADKPTKAGSDDIPGFKDFSSKLSDQIVRRMKQRISGTSFTPPPPPKRRKKVVLTKQAMEQSEQSPVIEKEPFHILDSADPSSDPKENKDFSEIKYVKQYLTKYVDNKFDDLKVFIKDNLKVLMKSVRKIKRKKKTARSLPISDEEVIEEDNVNQPETTNQFVEHNSPIDMEFVNNVLIDNPDVEVEEETQDDDTLKDKRGNDDLSEPLSTMDVPLAGNFDDTSKDPQAGEEVSDEVRYNKKYRVAYQDDVVDLDTQKNEQSSAVQDVDDNIPLPDKVLVNIDTSDSTTSTSISAGTQKAIYVLIAGLHSPLCVQPLSAVKSHSLTGTHQFNQMPSRILQSPYVTEFDSTDKGKQKVEEEVFPISPFDGFGISFQFLSNLFDEYSKWISKGLLKNHASEKSMDDKYRAKLALFGFEHMDFVFAFAKNKKWFYAISQPKNADISDEHIDVVLYYLRKKSKLRSPNEYRFTTINCLFKTFINDVYNRYYCSASDDNLTTQEHMARGAVVSAIERSIINIIKEFFIPAGLPWHLVDEVYIPANSDGEFHWVLAVVVLKERLIRVYDSSMGTRVKEPCGEIKKVGDYAVIFPS